MNKNGRLNIYIESPSKVATRDISRETRDRETVFPREKGRGRRRIRTRQRNGYFERVGVVAFSCSAMRRSAESEKNLRRGRQWLTVRIDNITKYEK